MTMRPAASHAGRARVPGVELRIGFLGAPVPTARPLPRKHNAVVVPRRLGETFGALTVDAAEIHRLRALSLFLGHLLKPFAGHARGSDAVEIAALLEGFRHRGVAGNVSGGAHFHRVEVADDQNIAGRSAE